MRVEEVAQELGTSKSHAYKVIHKLNAELREKGYPYQAAALLRQAENVQHHCPADHHLAE